jgi:NADPH:quinone reductase-like Zn-dependent oxidoreductase
MKAIADLVTAGHLRPTVSATVPLAKAAAAHSLGEDGHTTGKIVLTIAD